MINHSELFDNLAACMSLENDLPYDQARVLVGWLDLEGVLDYEILEETYVEPQVANTPTLYVIANDEGVRE